MSERCHIRTHAAQRKVRFHPQLIGAGLIDFMV
jgi:hypothetical protein